MDHMLSKALREFNSGPLNQLLVNLGGDEGPVWEEMLKRFNRKEACWNGTSSAKIVRDLKKLKLIKTITVEGCEHNVDFFLSNRWLRGIEHVKTGRFERMLAYAVGKTVSCGSHKMDIFRFSDFSVTEDVGACDTEIAQEVNQPWHKTIDECLASVFSRLDMLHFQNEAGHGLATNGRSNIEHALVGGELIKVTCQLADNTWEWDCAPFDELSYHGDHQFSCPPNGWDFGSKQKKRK